MEYEHTNLWDYINRLLNIREHELSSKQELIELTAYSIISLLIPFVFKQPQLLVGTVVNSMLILAALNLKGKNILPMIMLPSIAAAAGGYLFGGLTVYMVYLVPFIWLGNTILVLSFKHFRLQQNRNFFLTLGIGSLAKAGFLFGITFLLVSLAIVPALFLTAMGILQLITALSGGVLAFAIQRIKTKII